MEHLKEPKGEKLTWRQPNALVRYHELRSDGALRAILGWNMMYGSLATGECGEGRFTFKRGGFLRPYVTVRTEGSEGNLAVMRFDSSSVIRNAVIGLSGTAEFSTGHRFVFSRLSLRKSRWAFADEDGNVLVTFDRRIRGKPSGTVTVSEGGKRAPHIQTLVLLGWYVLMLDYAEAEAALGTGIQLANNG